VIQHSVPAPDCWSRPAIGAVGARIRRPDVLDFHTGTTGFEVTAFNIAGMDVPEVKAMVELYPVGQIFDNHVYPGVLHNAFMDVGIPAFTPEIGAARYSMTANLAYKSKAKGRRNESPLDQPTKFCSLLPQALPQKMLAGPEGPISH
jgi:hypothetical protein